MKNFIKTLAGKTALFIFCILSILTLGACILGIAFYTGSFGSSDINAYTMSEEALQKQLVADEVLRPYAYRVLRAQIWGSKMPSDADYRITDGNECAVAASQAYGTGNRTAYTAVFGVLRDTEGNVTDLYYISYDADGTERMTVSLMLTEGTKLYREIQLLSALLHTAYALRYWVYGIAPVAFLFGAMSFVVLMYAAGRRPKTDALFHGPLYRVPFDLLLGVYAGMGIGLVYIVASCWWSVMDTLTAMLVGLACLAGLNLLLGLAMCTASRLKQHTLLRYTVLFLLLKLLWKILTGLWTLLRGIPLVWKTALGVLAVTGIEFVVLQAAYPSYDTLTVCWLFEKVLSIPAVLYVAILLRRLQRSGSILAEGNLTYHTETNGMFGDFKRHGEALNRIAEGMSVAVEEKLKSERMKTALITNVSHDLKTPLTSVINYATLIGAEPCDNEKITAYAAVLVRQSEKLKRLIEDLVEASKASTGNLEVSPAPCDAATFLTQTGGEYEEKLRAAGLTLITRQPEKALRILADGRRMWRVFDNLMNNICKYALPGTRVYLSLAEQDGQAVFFFKNTAREALDMTEAELTERFTRGDTARNTEGNGLGLSIAKSLTELQGGSLHILADGDLYKVVLRFPLI